MTFSEFVKLMKRKQGTLYTLTFVIVILTIGISLLFPLRYEAKSRLLIIQNTNSNTDAYQLSRSNEYLGNLFAEVAYSSSFFDSVMGSSYNIDKNYFSGNYRDQINAWRQTVSTKTLNDTGIVEISVYHTNPYQAQQLALAINNEIANKNINYQGNQGIKVNIIDQPLVSAYPVKPNIIQNMIIALMASLLLSIFYIYLFPEERYDLSFWSKKKKTHQKARFHEPAISYYPSGDVNTRTNIPVDINGQPVDPDYQPQGNIANILK